jgi:adenosyl cobinamide kinase/adenosyl cobinamide phosphate guanylyltransferase
MLTVLTGGARSGKSSLAVEIGRRHEGDVVFVATCPTNDADLATRIAAHRSERPDWPTLEEPLDIVGALEQAGAATLVIVDCLTLWVSNSMWHGRADRDIEHHAASFAAAAADRPGDVVVVTNEVGLGVHPETTLGRRYRDVLGRVNQIAVSRADRALLLVAGRAVPLTDPWENLTRR